MSATCNVRREAVRRLDFGPTVFHSWIVDSIDGRELSRPAAPFVCASDEKARFFPSTMDSGRVESERAEEGEEENARRSLRLEDTW